jgi:hypothetical protein
MRGGFSYDVSPAKNAPTPACASATLPYENGIIKPGSQALSTASLVNRLPAPPMPATINRDKAPSLTSIAILHLIPQMTAAILARVRQRRLLPADMEFAAMPM